jgi:hypothetical protein
VVDLLDPRFGPMACGSGRSRCREIGFTAKPQDDRYECRNSLCVALDRIAQLTNRRLRTKAFTRFDETCCVLIAGRAGASRCCGMADHQIMINRTSNHRSELRSPRLRLTPN